MSCRATDKQIPGISLETCPFLRLRKHQVLPTFFLLSCSLRASSTVRAFSKGGIFNLRESIRYTQACALGSASRPGGRTCQPWGPNLPGRSADAQLMLPVQDLSAEVIPNSIEELLV